MEEILDECVDVGRDLESNHFDLVLTQTQQLHKIVLYLLTMDMES